MNEPDCFVVIAQRPALPSLLCALLLAAQPAQAQVYNWTSGDYQASGLPNPLPSVAVVNAAAGGTKSFAGLLENDGRINWLSSDGLLFAQIGSRLWNRGTFDVQQDTRFNAVQTGTFDNQGLLRKGGGSGELQVDVSLRNRASGVVEAASGSIRYRAGGTIDAGAAFTGAGGHVFDGGSYVFGGAWSATAGLVRFAAGSFTSATGQLAAIGGDLSWTGGTLAGQWLNPAARQFNAEGGTTKSISGTFTNEGRVRWSTADPLRFAANGTQLRNLGEFDLSQDSRFFAVQTGTFDNAGTLRKSGGSGSLQFDVALINRSGAVLASDSGTLAYRGGGTLETDSSFTGLGLHLFDGGTYTFGGRFNGPTNTVRFLAGNFNAASGATATIETDLLWSGGTLNGGWLNAAGRTLSGGSGGDKRVVQQLSNEGQINWITSDPLVLAQSGATLLNAGVLDFQRDTAIAVVATGVLDNRALLLKSGGGGDLLIDAVLLQRAGAVLDAGAGAIRYRRGGTIEPGSLFTGLGGLHVFEGPNANSSPFLFSGGLSGPANNLLFAAGLFVNTGAAPLALATNLSWSGGTLDGAWRNPADRVLTALPGGTKLVSERFVNEGRFNLATPETLLLGSNGASFENQGLFDFVLDGDIAPIGAANFTNTGVVRKSGGTGESRISTALSNPGAMEALSGTLRVPDNWTNAGTLRGTAAFQSSRVFNAGDIMAGMPTGPDRVASLSFVGGLTNQAAGALLIDVGPGGLSDLIEVSGSVVFGGTLRVSPADGYLPNVGDSFLVMTYAGRSGALAAVVPTNFAPGVVFTPVYQAQALLLTVTAVPEPAAAVLFAAGLGVVWVRARVRQRHALGAGRVA